MWKKQDQTNRTSRPHHLVIIGMIIVLAFAVYANSLGGQFVGDDTSLIKYNTAIKSWRNLPDLFTQDMATGANVKYNFYRPVLMLSFMADYHVWKSDVRGYHFVNIVLHILTTLLVYSLVNILFKDRLLALLTGILFVVHPVHTESVASIANRQESLVFLFMLASSILYIMHVRANRIAIYALMLISYILALLSKENALILPALFLLYHYAMRSKPKYRDFLPVVGITLLYILLRITVLRSSLADVSMLTSSPLERMPGFFAAIVNYIRLLVLPVHLHIDYGYPLFSIFNPRVILGITISFLSLICALKIRNKNILACFAIFWFFITLLPVCGIYPTGSYMAERYLYIPSVGFFLIAAKLLSDLYRAKNLKVLVSVLILGLLCVYSFLTIKQNNYWKDSITFCKRALKYVHDNPRFYDELGVAYYDIGENEEAIAAFTKALGIEPNDASVYNNLGNAYYATGKNKEAIGAYKRSLENNPRYQQAYYNLGNTYYKIGYTKEAIDAYLRALEIYPEYAEVYNNIAIAYYREGQYDLAIKHSNKALELGYEINPEFVNALESVR